MTDPAGENESHPVRHKNTLILIESECFSFCPETPVFLGFSAFQGRSRMLPGPAFFAFMRFSEALGKNGFVGILGRFVGILGRFVGILGRFVGL